MKLLAMILACVLVVVTSPASAQSRQEIDADDPVCRRVAAESNTDVELYRHYFGRYSDAVCGTLLLYQPRYGATRIGTWTAQDWRGYTSAEAELFHFVAQVSYRARFGDDTYARNVLEFFGQGVGTGWQPLADLLETIAVERGHRITAEGLSPPPRNRDGIQLSPLIADRF